MATCHDRMAKQTDFFKELWSDVDGEEDRSKSGLAISAYEWKKKTFADI